MYILADFYLQSFVTQPVKKHAVVGIIVGTYKKQWMHHATTYYIEVGAFVNAHYAHIAPCIEEDHIHHIDQVLNSPLPYFMFNKSVTSSITRTAKSRSLRE